MKRVKKFPEIHLVGLILAAFLVCSVFASDAAARARIVHVIVALADNQNQGIVPVPARLGNGQDAAANLYWGAAYGVKTYFKNTSGWKLLSSSAGPRAPILERCIFRHLKTETYLVADAYDGAKIREAITEFLSSTASVRSDSVTLGGAEGRLSLPIAGKADLIVYIGHDGLMDFQLPKIAGQPGGTQRQFIILACASQTYFRPYMRTTGSEPLLWTTGLMAPEAYTLKAALDGWMAGENAELIRQRAASAYDKYQHCGLRAAQRLFARDW